MSVVKLTEVDEYSSPKTVDQSVKQKISEMLQEKICQYTKCLDASSKQIKRHFYYLPKIRSKTVQKQGSNNSVQSGDTKIMKHISSSKKSPQVSHMSVLKTDTTASNNHFRSLLQSTKHNNSNNNLNALSHKSQFQFETPEKPSNKSNIKLKQIVKFYELQANPGPPHNDISGSGAQKHQRVLSQLTQQTSPSKESPAPALLRVGRSKSNCSHGKHLISMILESKVPAEVYAQQSAVLSRNVPGDFAAQDLVTEESKTNLTEKQSHLKSSPSEQGEGSTAKLLSGSALAKITQKKIRAKKKEIQGLNLDPRMQQFCMRYLEQEQHILACVEKKQLPQFIQCVSEILNLVVLVDDFELFIDLVYMIGRFCLDIGELSKSVFFFNQASLVCDLAHQFHKKIDIITDLAEAANQFKDYRIAILLLKKALQYAWKYDEPSKEVDIYDKVGVNYFYLSDIENAIFYHDRFMLGDLELRSSPTRQMGISQIDYFIQTSAIPFNKFNKVLLLYLSLPIYNVFSPKASYLQTGEEQDSISEGESPNQSISQNEQENESQCTDSRQHVSNLGASALTGKGSAVAVHSGQSLLRGSGDSASGQFLELLKNPKLFTKYWRCDEQRNANYNNANGVHILEVYVKQKEFILEITTPKYTRINQHVLENKQQALHLLFRREERMIPPRILIEKKMKDEKVLQQIHRDKDNDFENPRKYKITLEKYLSYKSRHFNTNNQVEQRAFNQVKLSYNKYQGGRSKLNQIIYMNHLTLERQMKSLQLAQDPVLLRKRFENYLDGYLQNFITRLQTPRQKTQQNEQD